VVRSKPSKDSGPRHPGGLRFPPAKAQPGLVCSTDPDTPKGTLLEHHFALENVFPVHKRRPQDLVKQVANRAGITRT
jgi:hypothetical protein